MFHVTVPIWSSLAHIRFDFSELLTLLHKWPRILNQTVKPHTNKAKYLGMDCQHIKQTYAKRTHQKEKKIEHEIQKTVLATRQRL